jgi:hypothetical protein
VQSIVPPSVSRDWDVLSPKRTNLPLEDMKLHWLKTSKFEKTDHISWFEVCVVLCFLISIQSIYPIISLPFSLVTQITNQEYTIIFMYLLEFMHLSPPISLPKSKNKLHPGKILFMRVVAIYSQPYTIVRLACLNVCHHR